ncbi:MAG TPA: DUF1634 domain-containing protein [Candidatus Xenobia bacterium]
MKLTDEQVEVMVSRLLRGGVTLSSVVVAAGLAKIFLDREPIRGFHHFRPAEPPMPGWNGPFLIWVGLAILFATPVLRVALTVVAFSVQHDRRYVSVALFVLGVLLYSMAYGN